MGGQHRGGRQNRNQNHDDTRWGGNAGRQGGNWQQGPRNQHDDRNSRDNQDGDQNYGQGNWDRTDRIAGQNDYGRQSMQDGESGNRHWRGTDWEGNDGGRSGWEGGENTGRGRRSMGQGGYGENDNMQDNDDYQDRFSQGRFNQRNTSPNDFRNAGSGSRSQSRRAGQGYSQQGQYGTDSFGSGWSPGQESGPGTQRGQHSGKGPKGYQRSDERIREDVSEALSQHGDIDASEIEVQVKGGEVTLSGTVRDRGEKRAAEDAAENCAGVKDVQNRIRVQSENGSASQGAGKDREGSRAKSPIGSPS